MHLRDYFSILASCQCQSEIKVFLYIIDLIPVIAKMDRYGNLWIRKTYQTLGFNRLISFYHSIFFQVCHPILPDGTDCSSPQNQGKYIVDFTCANDPTARILKEVRLSFPSGHSSFSAYTMIYCAVSSTHQLE